MDKGEQTLKSFKTVVNFILILEFRNEISQAIKGIY